MCKWDDTKPVWVKIAADLSATGKGRWRQKQIDSCIAPIVQALQEGGIDMRGSCCGHGLRSFGEIYLQDGRTLVITDEAYWRNQWRWAARALVSAVRFQAQVWGNRLNRSGRFLAQCLAGCSESTDNPAVELQEMVRQPYEDCAFSAGLVLGHPVEQVYLKLQRGSEEPTVILLRADEAQALAWVLTGAVWSFMMLKEK